MMWLAANEGQNDVIPKQIVIHSAKFLDKSAASTILSHMANQLDSFFAALSDPTRRAVIERLVEGPAPVGELHAPHDMALPTFMKHLARLEAAGLVRTEKKGRVRTVHIEAAPLAIAEDWLSRHRRLWEQRLDRIEQLATRLEQNEQEIPNG